MLLEAHVGRPVGRSVDRSVGPRFRWPGESPRAGSDTTLPLFSMPVAEVRQVAASVGLVAGTADAQVEEGNDAHNRWKLKLPQHHD